MRHITPLMGSVYTGQSRAVIDTTNMAPVFTMPETTSRPVSVVDQTIPGVTTTLPTPNNPTVTAISTPLSTTVMQTTAVPWYQWFKDHPLYTGLIGAGVIGGIYLLTKKKGRK